MTFMQAFMQSRQQQRQQPQPARRLRHGAAGATTTLAAASTSPDASGGAGISSAAPASAAAVAGGAAAEQMLARLCRRLRQVLEQENELLQRGAAGPAGTAALAETARQKDLLQLDILRLGERCTNLQALQEEMRAELMELRAALEENARLLALHLNAAQELARHLEQDLRRRSSDGTYTPGSLHAASAGAASADGGMGAGHGMASGAATSAGHAAGSGTRGYGTW